MLNVVAPSTVDAPTLVKVLGASSTSEQLYGKVA